MGCRRRWPPRAHRSIFSGRCMKLIAAVIAACAFTTISGTIVVDSFKASTNCSIAPQNDATNQRTSDGDRYSQESKPIVFRSDASVYKQQSQTGPANVDKKCDPIWFVMWTKYTDRIKATDIALVFVGLVGLLFGHRQLRIYDRQTDIQKRQHLAAHRPRLILRESKQ